MTTPTLAQVANVEALAQLIESRHIAATAHPSQPLWILNYTPKAQYEGLWTPETRLARGLVVSGETPAHPDNPVLARPFPKFHNAAEHIRPGTSLPALPAREAVKVTAKLDGSLGILYTAPDGTRAVATRGSFASDQAKWASAHFAQHYADAELTTDATYLFEIIYPTNRIVVDYADLADLVLLAVIDNASGADLPIPANWPGPVVDHFDYATLDALISAVDAAPLEVQRNAEGFVARFASGLRVKVKYAEYVRLHRIITGIDAKTIYEYAGCEAMAAQARPKDIAFALGLPEAKVAELIDIDGGPFAELLDAVPDEFYDWVTATVASLRTSATAELTAVQAAYAERPKGVTPRQLAEYVKSTKVNQTALFSLISGKAPELAIWRSIRPAPSKPFFANDEEP
jgi:RNA ligase